VIWIRCEANRNVGHGHLGRCRALAEEFRIRGYEVGYACTSESLETFRSYGIEPTTVLLYDLPGSGTHGNRTSRDFYIVDDYRLKGKFKDVLEIEDDVTKPLIRNEFIRFRYKAPYLGSSGQRALEAAYEGRPMVLTCAAKNQERYFSHFIAAGIAATDKIHPGMWLAAQAYSLNMKPANVYLASKAITELDYADKREVLELRNQDYIRATCFDDRVITPDEHENWWELNGHNVQRITAHNEFAGIVSIIDGEISLYIKKEFQRLSFGEVVLGMFKDKPLKARIKPDNYASLKLFTKCGFIKNDDYYCRD